MLTSRSGSVVRDGQGLEERLSALKYAHGLRIIVRSCDSSSILEVGIIFGCFAPSIVLHMPHTLRDRLIRSMHSSDVPYVFSAKAVGSWNSRVTSAKFKLTCMVLFSSIASFGGVGTAAHSATNAYLDAAAIASAAAGLSARSLVVPVVLGEGAGAVAYASKVSAADPTTLAVALTPAEVLTSLHAVLTPSWCAFPVQGPLFEDRQKVLDGLGHHTPHQMLLLDMRQELASAGTVRVFRSLPLTERLAKFEAAKVALDTLCSSAPTLAMPPLSEVSIVGAGLTGLAIACAFADGIVPDVHIFEKSVSVGGVWRWQSNPYSRVNSSEPGYRLGIGRQATNSNHSFAFEILDDCREAIVQHRLHRCMFLQTSINSVSRNEGEVNWSMKGSSFGLAFRVQSKLVVLCTNRRLGNPRDDKFPGEGGFRGLICRGLQGDNVRLPWRAQRVAVIGMGAFAVEQVRTALEHGASHVHVLVRRHGLVCPQVIDYLNYIRPFTDNFEHPVSGSGEMVSFWQHAYKEAGAHPPESWKERKYRPDGHTVSVSDIWFVGHRLQVIGTSQDEIERFLLDGIHTIGGVFMQVVFKKL